jgi:hypothetical protein
MAFATPLNSGVRRSPPSTPTSPLRGASRLHAKSGPLGTHLSVQGTARRPLRLAIGTGAGSALAPRPRRPLPCGSRRVPLTPVRHQLADGLAPLRLGAAPDGVLHACGSRTSTSPTYRSPPGTAREVRIG